MATRNKLSDLNNHLFEQLERLNDDDYMNENADKEIERSKAIANVGKTIIENGKLASDAQKHADEWGYGQDRKPRSLPHLLGTSDEES